MDSSDSKSCHLLDHQNVTSLIESQNLSELNETEGIKRTLKTTDKAKLAPIIILNAEKYIAQQPGTTLDNNRQPQISETFKDNLIVKNNLSAHKDIASLGAANSKSSVQKADHFHGHNFDFIKLGSDRRCSEMSVGDSCDSREKIVGGVLYPYTCVVEIVTPREQTDQHGSHTTDRPTLTRQDSANFEIVDEQSLRNATTFGVAKNCTENFTSCGVAYTSRCCVGKSLGSLSAGKVNKRNVDYETDQCFSSVSAGNVESNVADNLGIAGNGMGSCSKKDPQKSMWYMEKETRDKRDRCFNTVGTKDFQSSLSEKTVCTGKDWRNSVGNFSEYTPKTKGCVESALSSNGRRSVSHKKKIKNLNLIFFNQQFTSKHRSTILRHIKSKNFKGNKTGAIRQSKERRRKNWLKRKGSPSNLRLFTNTASLNNQINTGLNVGRFISENFRLIGLETKNELLGIMNNLRTNLNYGIRFIRDKCLSVNVDISKTKATDLDEECRAHGNRDTPCRNIQKGMKRQSWKHSRVRSIQRGRWPSQYLMSINLSGSGKSSGHFPHVNLGERTESSQKLMNRNIRSNENSKFVNLRSSQNVISRNMGSGLISMKRNLVSALNLLKKYLGSSLDLLKKYSGSNKNSMKGNLKSNQNFINENLVDRLKPGQSLGHKLSSHDPGENCSQNRRDRYETDLDDYDDERPRGKSRKKRYDDDYDDERPRGKSRKKRHDDDYDDYDDEDEDMASAYSDAYSSVYEVRPTGRSSFKEEELAEIGDEDKESINEDHNAFGYQFKAYLSGTPLTNAFLTLWHLVLLVMSIAFVILGCLVEYYFSRFLIDMVKKLPKYAIYAKFLHPLDEKHDKLEEISGYAETFGALLLICHACYLSSHVLYVTYGIHKIQFTLPISALLTGAVAFVEINVINVVLDHDLISSGSRVTELKCKVLEYEVRSNKSFDISYDYLAILLHCCGIIEYYDFLTKVEFSYEKTMTDGSIKQVAIQLPPTCCKQERFAIARNVHDCAEQGIHHYSEGCLEKILELIAYGCHIYTIIVWIHLIDICFHASLYGKKVTTLSQVLDLNSERHDQMMEYFLRRKLEKEMYEMYEMFGPIKRKKEDRRRRRSSKKKSKSKKSKKDKKKKSKKKKKKKKKKKGQKVEEEDYGDDVDEGYLDEYDEYYDDDEDY